MVGDGRGGEGRERRVCLVLKLPLATPLSAKCSVAYIGYIHTLSTTNPVNAPMSTPHAPY